MPTLGMKIPCALSLFALYRAPTVAPAQIEAPQEIEAVAPVHDTAGGDIECFCPDGYELISEECYPSCKQGYESDGVWCRKPCPEGNYDTGDSCLETNHNRIYYPDYYTRGHPEPFVCGEGAEFDSYDLCYKKCKDGYTGIDSTCWENCKEGWWENDNHGETCERGLDIHWKKKYERPNSWKPHECPSGLEEDSGMCFPPCKSGYVGEYSNCREECPPKYVYWITPVTEQGCHPISHKKESYKRVARR